MEVHLQDFIEWMQTLAPITIYLVFGLIAYLENVLPPIPGDILVAFGGYLAAERIISFNSVLWVTVVASVIGFMSMYAIGKHFGDRIEKERSKFWLMKFVNIKYFDRGKRWMARYGQLVIVANRFLAGTRSVISLTAGLTKTPVMPTIVSSFISSLAWNAILLSLGWVIHENWQVIGDYLNVYGWIVLILIVVFLLLRYIYKKKFVRRS